MFADHQFGREGIQGAIGVDRQPIRPLDFAKAQGIAVDIPCRKPCLPSSINLSGWQGIGGDLRQVVHFHDVNVKCFCVAVGFSIIHGDVNGQITKPVGRRNDFIARYLIMFTSGDIQREGFVIWVNDRENFRTDKQRTVFQNLLRGQFCNNRGVIDAVNHDLQCPGVADGIAI